jgi:hypothetical protein
VVGGREKRKEYWKVDRVGLMNLGWWRMKGLKGFGGVFFTFTTPLFLIPLNWGEFVGTLDVKKKKFVKFFLMVSIYVFFFN